MSKDMIEPKQPDGLLYYVDRLDKNIEKLNDNFILHRGKTEPQIELIVERLIKWIKVLALVAFIAVGGASVLKLLGII